MSKYKGFSSVQLKQPGRSTFDLSHEKRVSSRIGKLVPILISETLPNDTFRGSTEVLIKLAPMIAPIFHRLNMYVHFFFVPNRILWEDWETFITGGRLGAAVTSPPVPPNMKVREILQMNENLLNVGSVADYLGVPQWGDASYAVWEDQTIDMLPFAAWYKVYTDYYRDRNFEADTDVLPLQSGQLAPGDSAALLLRMKNRCWEHDYYTSALPFTQRGAEVLMPLEGTGMVNYSTHSKVYRADGEIPGLGLEPIITGELNPSDVSITEAGDTHPFARIENIDSVDIDASSVSINDLRRAVRLQEWLEKNALAGSRYNESIMAHFGRRTSDARLQRAEYLGGGKAVVQISEVMTTSYSDDAEAQLVPPGNMVGRGSAYGNTNSFSYNCEEHGFVIGILSVLPTTGYFNGLPRMFVSRSSQLDYPFPSFAHLGEQPVYDYELHMNNISMPNDNTSFPVFGYQSRYADWKYMNSTAHGDFKSSLDFWHLCRKFTEIPDLGNEFVHVENSLQDRIFNVEGVDTLWMYIYNKLSVTRALPYFGTPML